MKFTKVLLVVAMSLVLASSAFAEINFSANMESNMDFTATSAELGNITKDQDKTKFDNGGRVEFNLSSKKESDSGMFVESKGTLLVKFDGTAAVDDSWIKIGTSSMNVQIGRWETEGLFDKGEDIFIVDAPYGPGRYEANYARGRDNAGLALNITSGENLLITLGTIYGQGTTNAYDIVDADGVVVTSGEVDTNKLGVRPLVKFSTDTFTIKAGADYLMETPRDGDAEGETKKLGFGVGASMKAGSMTIGLAGARGVVSGKIYLDAIDAEVYETSDLDDATTTSVWGYLNMPVGEKDLLGVGAGYTMKEFDDSDVEGKHLQGFVGYSHALPVEGAKVKVCGSYASGTVDSGIVELDSSAFGARIRVNYDF